MKTIIKGLLAIISLIIGLFIFLIGQMGDEGTAPLPFIWYALLVIFFGAPIILIVTIAKEKMKR
jgi:hypothetical protein